MAEQELAIPAGIPGVGEVIAGKYNVERVLGVGGMGIVLAARHIRLDEAVAIKILLPELARNPEVVERFMREARAAVRIKNEHVGRVFDVEMLESGTPYMVMECLQGSDLKDVLAATGPLSPTVAVDYVLQACEALIEAHNRGIVHRDLKPSNLYLAQKPDGSTLIKVLDFGIAKTAETADHGMTKTNTQMGTPFYMAPEQIQGSRDIDGRVDIWALGVVLFELLTNKLPFEGETIGAISVNVVVNPSPSVRSLRADVPPALDAVIQRCLAKGREARFASISALAEALAPLASSEGVASSQRILRSAGRPVSNPSLADIDVPGEASRAPAPPAPELASPDRRAPAPSAKTDGPWQQEPPPKPATRSRMWLAIVLAGLATGGVAVAFFLRSEQRPSVEPERMVASASVSAPIESVDAAVAPSTIAALPIVSPEPVAPAASTTSRRNRTRPPPTVAKPLPVPTPSARTTTREPLPAIH